VRAPLLYPRDLPLTFLHHPYRYGDILAYDRTRCLPPLRTTDSPAEPDYVNASLVREPDLGFDDDVLPRRWWVAAQVRNRPHSRFERSRREPARSASSPS